MLTHGPVVGGATPYDVKVFLRTDRQANVVIQYGNDPDLTVFSLTNTLTTYPKHDFTRIIHITGLQPNTIYFVNISVNGIDQFTKPFPSFKTFPKSSLPQPFSFLVLTDFDNQRSVKNVFPTFLNASEEKVSFVFIGGDFDHRNPETLSNKRQMFKDLYNPISLGLQDFVKKILWRMPIVHQWDDHDAGINNIDKTYPYWSLSYQVFCDYVPRYALPSTTPGIWQRFKYAHTDFFILDGRSQRDPDVDPDNGDKSMLDGNSLGASGQLEWLKQGLLLSTATWKIIFSSVVTNPTTKPDDGWAAFQTEWKLIRGFIESNKISGVIFISGDLHMGGIDNGIASGFPEMVVPSPNLNTCTSSTIGKWSEGIYYNSSGPCRGYGIITVLTDPDRVLLEVKDENGNVRLSYLVSQ
jgi:alkaline phosphatase D